MLSIKKILLPTDGSSHSYEALRYASSFAREFNITIYLLTVIEIHHSIYDVYADEITIDMQESRIAAMVNQRLDETEKKAQEMVKYIYDRAYRVFIYSPLSLYAVNKEVNFVPYKSTFMRLKETSVTDLHWSLRGKNN